MDSGLGVAAGCSCWRARGDKGRKQGKIGDIFSGRMDTWMVYSWAVRRSEHTKEDKAKRRLRERRVLLYPRSRRRSSSGYSVAMRAMKTKKRTHTTIQNYATKKYCSHLSGQTGFLLLIVVISILDDRSGSHLSPKKQYFKMYASREFRE